MRISDWSSDVCSSDLRHQGSPARFPTSPAHRSGLLRTASALVDCCGRLARLHLSSEHPIDNFDQIGRVDFLRVILLHLAHKLDGVGAIDAGKLIRSEEHTSELQSLMRTSYAVFCLKKKKKK